MSAYRGEEMRQSEFLFVYTTLPWAPKKPKAYWGIVIRVTQQYMYQYGPTAEDIVKAYLGKDTSEKFIKSLEVMQFVVQDVMAIDIRLISETQHDKLYALTEGAQIPRVPLDTASLGTGHFSF